ncbi:unnamed protein product [Trichobilharzia szidati]|nr:unnamed protein product [Trichobilharzia szidati]
MCFRGVKSPENEGVDSVKSTQSNKLSPSKIEREKSKSTLCSLSFSPKSHSPKSSEQKRRKHILSNEELNQLTKQSSQHLYHFNMPLTTDCE